MGYKNVLPATAAQFNPFIAGVLSAQDAQSAIDEIAGRLPPVPADCSSFLNSIIGIDDVIASSLAQSALYRNRQTEIATMIAEGGLTPGEIAALEAESAALQVEIDVIAGQVTVLEADRATATHDFQTCEGEIPNAGPTASRPTGPPTGFSYFDTDLGRPIWFKGSSFGWVFADGTSV